MRFSPNTWLGRYQILSVLGAVPLAVAEELALISGWNRGSERPKQRAALLNRLTEDLRMLDKEELDELQKSFSLTLTVSA